jgi:hypothetical protein
MIFALQHDFQVWMKWREKENFSSSIRVDENNFPHHKTASAVAAAKSVGEECFYCARSAFTKGSEKTWKKFLIGILWRCAQHLVINFPWEISHKDENYYFECSHCLM